MLDKVFSLVGVQVLSVEKFALLKYFGHPSAGTIYSKISKGPSQRLHMNIVLVSMSIALFSMGAVMLNYLVILTGNKHEN